MGRRQNQQLLRLAGGSQQQDKSLKQPATQRDDAKKAGHTRPAVEDAPPTKKARLDLGRNSPGGVGAAGVTSTTTTPTAPATIQLDNAVTDDMLRVTIHTMRLLGKNIDLFRSSRFKELRVVTYPLVTAPTGGHINRVSDALVDQRYYDAKLALEGLRQLKEVPKLGSVQRWVRELDLAGMDETERDAMLALDMVLRTAAAEQVSTLPLPAEFLDKQKEEPEVVFRPADWDPVGETPEPRKFEDGEIEAIAKKFSVLHREKAQERRPVNLHDMIIYHAPPNAVPMRPATTVDVRVHRSKELPMSVYLEGLLSREEAATLVATAEAVGMTQDEPQTGKASILAHHFVWMADESFIGNIFNRCKKFLPQTLNGSPIVGLNGRLRCYRYVPGSVYRPHVDGAWPQSGIDEDNNYIYDISQGSVTSKLTFLLYLNEGFEGGQTKFYTPALEEGHLKTTSVLPRQGGTFIFPHADAACLVHEGAAVTKGAKYIIRTEVLYKVK